jgi:alpha-L-rhamnosidase
MRARGGEFLLFVSARALAASAALGAPQPWPWLYGGAFSGAAAPESPDPLVRYEWPLNRINESVLQIYTVPAVALTTAAGTPPTSFTNVSSAVGSVACNIHVQGPGQLVIDWGVELPGWFEFDSVADIDVGNLLLGIGEYSAVEFVGAYKSAAPAVYCGDRALCTYRLETNPVGPELYEGVRFAFLTLLSPPAFNFTIVGLRVVAQAKPVNYVGSFSVPGDALLERIFYTGAYTVRATMQGDYFGSILINRGDRIGWTGDLHPTQAASLAVFGNFDFVLSNLNRSSCPDCCNGIATYCIYFVLSLVDYFYASGDAVAVHALAGAVTAKLEAAAHLYPHPVGLRFVGHDDRLGDGFCDPDTAETAAVYRFLAIRAWMSYSRVAAAVGDAAGAARYANLSASAIAALRAAPVQPWWGGLGVHAVAEALAGGWATPAEAAAAADARLGDIVTLPSQSNFQTYFILIALARAGLLDRGVEVSRVAWGAPIALGATTTWEQSHPDWAHPNVMAPGPGPVPNEAGWSSLAHPWSAGVTAWLSAWVLGVRRSDGGRLLVAPHIPRGAGGAGVSGRIRLGAGTVTLSVRVEPCGGARIMVSLPPGEDADLVLSSVTLRRLGALGSDGDLADVELTDGSTDARLAAVHAVGHEAAPRSDEHFGGGEARAPALVVRLSGGVAHSLLARLRSASTCIPPPPPDAEASPFPPASWPGRLVGTDTTTRGAWRGKFGAAGFYFPGGLNGSALMSLPPWVASVTLWGPDNSGYNGKQFSWTGVESDARALEAPNGTGRLLGAGAPSGSGSFPLDLVLGPSESTRSWSLSLYFVDLGPTPWGDGQSGPRQQEVYLLSLPSLDPAAPRTALRGFSGGVWLTFDVVGSVRVRTTTIRGDYAVLSAVCFD